MTSAPFIEIALAVVAIVGGVLGMFAASYKTEEERSAETVRVIAEQLAGSETGETGRSSGSLDPVLLEAIRQALNDALNGRGAQMGSSPVCPTTGETPRP